MTVRSFCTTKEVINRAKTTYKMVENNFQFIYLKEDSYLEYEYTIKTLNINQIIQL